jgi:Monooxygenase af470-like
MAKVAAKRVTAKIDGDFVVFLIGMRINKPWKPHKWLPVFRAMPRMIRELERHPESGFLGHIMSLGVIVQYWRSFEQLEAYARDPNQFHWPAWVAFNKRVGQVEAMWASSMRPTGCAPVNTSACTAECHCSVWQRPVQQSTRSGGWSQREAGSKPRRQCRAIQRIGQRPSNGRLQPTMSPRSAAHRRSRRPAACSRTRARERIRGEERPADPWSPDDDVSL